MWPNSWKNVTTSVCRNSDGASSVGFVKFATIALIGSWYEPSGSTRPPRSVNAAAWPNLFGRGYRSM